MGGAQDRADSSAKALRQDCACHGQEPARRPVQLKQREHGGEQQEVRLGRSWVGGGWIISDLQGHGESSSFLSE